MKTLLLIPLFLLFMSVAIAQPDQSKKEQIESAKIAYITKRVNLTPSQAKTFWPLYNEFSDKRKALKQRQRELDQNMGSLTATDKEVEAALNQLFELKKERLQLEITYNDKFKTILSSRQILELYKSEKDFLRILREKVGGRPPHGHHGPPPGFTGDDEPDFD